MSAADAAPWRGRRPAVAALATVALVAASVVSAAPVQAAAGHSYLLAIGENGDIATSGAPTFFLEDSTYTPDLSASRLYLRVVDTFREWHMDLRAPAGETLVAGATYTDVQLASTAVAPHAGLEVAGTANPCATVTGAFTVLELTHAPGTGEITGFAVSYEQWCNGRPWGSRGVVGYQASKSGSVFFDSTVDHAVPTGPVSVRASLYDSTGTPSGAPVTVFRPDDLGGTVTFATTNGAQGVYVEDVMGVTDRVYTLSYAGDASHYPATAEVFVAAVRTESFISLDPKAPVSRGSSYTMSGTLTSQGVPVPEASVTLTRKDLAGTTTVEVTTAANGTFSTVDTPVVGGDVAWTATFAGTAPAGPASTSSHVSVSRSATTMSVSVDRPLYAYGARARIRVHLGATYNSRVVSIYAKRYGVGTTTLVARGTVNSSGDLVGSYPMTMRTVITAKFEGDYRYAPRTVSIWRSSHQKVALRMYGYRSRSGTTFTYSVGTNPEGLVLILPGWKHSKLQVNLDRWNGRSWSVVVSRGVQPELDGSYGFAIAAPRTRTTLRLKLTALPSYYNADGSYGWVYLRFV